MNFFFSTQFSGVTDSQRFISLYSPDSPEELFCYAQKGKKPTSFMRIKEPLLILLAQKDEYRDRAMKKIASWFRKYSNKHSTTSIIENASHNFWGKEHMIVNSIQQWTQNLRS